MRITVTTPTGHVGSRVVVRLLQAGVRPTVLVRDPSRLAAEIAERVDVVVGDQTDPAAVRAAVRGADALFLVLPDSVEPDVAAGYARLARIAADAVRAEGVGHVVFQSSVGAEARHGFGEIDGLGVAELTLEASGAAVLHLRCGYFMSNLLLDPAGLRTGELTTTLPVELPMAWVAPDDIAAVAVGLLLARAWTGRAVQAVHGPADLSFADAARELSAATGHTFIARRISDDDVRAALRAGGLPDETVEGIVGMSAGVRDRAFTPEQPRNPLSTTPTSLGSWAFAHVRPLLG